MLSFREMPVKTCINTFEPYSMGLIVIKMIQMTLPYYRWLKWATLGAFIATYILITALSDHMHWARTSSAPAPVRTAAVPESVTVATRATNDVVPFPTCRDRYIDLSSDRAYPIPHWIYSLPKHADKALVLAIAKNESRFLPYAQSHAGAIGLMQLMPATAHYMLQKHGAMDAFLVTSGPEAHGYTPRNPFDFKDPYVSLAIGHRYIEYLQERPYIGDNIVYTLAAYNAGPGNLLKWKKRFGKLSPAVFAKRIPYRETRNYVRKVLHDYQRYQALLPNITETVWIDSDQC